MRKRFFSILLIPAVLAAASCASLELQPSTDSFSHSSGYFTDFDYQQPELAYETYQGGVQYPGVTCKPDACVTFEHQGNRTYGKFTVNHSSTPGFYQNVATSQVALGGEPPVDAGPYSLTSGHSLTLEAKIRWSGNYTSAGAGAVGTSGLVLWNSAVGPEGQTPEYDQVGFSWASQNVLGGFIAGFTAASFVDLNPVGIWYPAAPLNINNWIKVKLVWWQDAQAVQYISYYADDQFLGTDTLPTQLQGLSLEIWNDNQEPVFCETGLCTTFPNPDQSQSFYVDYVKVTQQ